MIDCSVPLSTCRETSCDAEMPGTDLNPIWAQRIGTLEAALYCIRDYLDQYWQFRLAVAVQTCITFSVT